MGTGDSSHEGGRPPVTEEAEWLTALAESRGSGEPQVPYAVPVPVVVRRGRRDGEPRPTTEVDWLGEAWDSLTPIVREVAQRTCGGESTVRLGYTMQLPEADIVQMQALAISAVGGAQRRHAPALVATLQGLLEGEPAVADADLRLHVPPATTAARAVLLTHAGAQPPTTWAGPLRGHWTLYPNVLHERLHQLAAQAPFSVAKAGIVAARLSVPSTVAWWDLLSEPTSPVRPSPTGWRPRHASIESSPADASNPS